MDAERHDRRRRGTRRRVRRRRRGRDSALELLAELEVKLGRPRAAASGTTCASSRTPRRRSRRPELPPTARPSENGNVIPDAGSFQPPSRRRGRGDAAARLSNALLVGAKRSATGHPFFVAGPQVGYFYPSSSSSSTCTAAASTRAASRSRARRTSDRPRPGLRLERDVLALRHHRPVRRDALRRRRHALPVQGPVPRRWGRSTPASLKGRGQPDHAAHASARRCTARCSATRPSAGEGRDLARALDARARAAERARVRRPRHGTGRTRPKSFFTRDEQGRVRRSTGSTPTTATSRSSRAARLPLRGRGVDLGLPTIGTGGTTGAASCRSARIAQAIDPPSG